MSMSRRDVLKAGALAGVLPLVVPLRRSLAATALPRRLRILILGGTGFIGPYQVAHAIARGHAVTVFNRGRSEVGLPAGVEQLLGDRDRGELEALAGREWDVCIDNPARVPHWVRDAGEVLRGKVRHYILVSTISVYADNATPGADEEAPLAAYAGPDPLRVSSANVRADMSLYGPLKAACEQEARKQFPGIATIVRPGLIVGPDDPTDRFTYWPVRLARGGDVVAPGDGSDPVQLIDARDLAEWMIHLAESHRFGTFNATGPALRMDMAAMLREVRTATGSDATLHWIPTDVLEAQRVASWVDMPAWVPARGDTAGFALRSNARALAAGLAFRPLATTAADTLAWFRGLPPARQDKLAAGLDAAREARILEAWRNASPDGSASPSTPAHAGANAP